MQKGYYDCMYVVCSMQYVVCTWMMDTCSIRKILVLCGTFTVRSVQCSAAFSIFFISSCTFLAGNVSHKSLAVCIPTAANLISDRRRIEFHEFSNAWLHRNEGFPRAQSGH